jgi:hypothetical protein
VHNAAVETQEKVIGIILQKNKQNQSKVKTHEWYLKWEYHGVLAEVNRRVVPRKPSDINGARCLQRI